MKPADCQDKNSDIHYKGLFVAEGTSKNDAAALLKELDDLFTVAYKHYAFGAFAKPKKNEIAQALSSDRLVWSLNAAGRVAGAVIFNVPRANSRHTDFSGRHCVIKPGDIYVREVAIKPGCEDEQAPMLMNTLSNRVQATQVWVEIHEENEALRHQIESQLGFRYVMTKIMASSEIRGLYCWPTNRVPMQSLPPYDEPPMLCARSGFLSPGDAGRLKDELSRYLGQEQAWAQHYSHYNRRHSWTAFSLRGYVPEAPGFIIKPSEMSKRWKAEHPKLLLAECQDTRAAQFFRFAMQVVARIPGRKERVRFMRLAPCNGELSRHADVTDRNAGMRDGQVVRLHIPLMTHEGVMFESWGLRGQHYSMHFAARGLYYLDQRKPHRVTNRSPVERIHLVVDVYTSSELRRWLGLQ
jgi:Aspartyl/Asparaginyl beta-hydroxylase